MVVLGALAEYLPVNEAPGYWIANPVGIEGLGFVEDLPVVSDVLTVVLSVGLLAAAASVVLRFRRSRGVERQQMKWFVYAASLLIAGAVSWPLPDVVENLLFSAVFFALPTAVGVAVLRYRLYDIDLLVNRTLVYAPLTAALVSVYVAGVIVLQYAFRTITGQHSQLAVVVSTLAIAALFSPLRRRTQQFVDRRFYRRKYDAQKTLAAFSAQLREETDLDALEDTVVGVVRDTMQPEHVSLWVRPAATSAAKRQD
jgi:hypothetical protein